MLLKDIVIRNAKPKDKPYKLNDGGGMYCYIHTNGGKYWRFKYHFMAKEKVLALGVYPEISLADAREKRTEARKLLALGKDPGAIKKEERHLALLNSENTFEAIAREWHKHNLSRWTEAHGAKILRRLALHIFPSVGSTAIKDIKPSELLTILRKIEGRGNTEISHRVLQTCTVVFRYAIATDRAEYNPAADLKGALKAHKAEHYPTIQAVELPIFYQKLEAVETSVLNKLAIRILLLTCLRQGELRLGEWQYVNFETKEWRIPAEHMKMRTEHIVPLAPQTIQHLKEVHALTGSGRYIFPSQHRRVHAYMSENTINKVLHYMGYKGKLVGHGTRALASTTLNEHGFKSDVIERQLAHAERNKVRAAYNRAQYLDERRQMMGWWADFLERAERGKGNVVEGKFGTMG